MTLPNQVQIRILASGIYPAPQFPPDIARALEEEVKRHGFAQVLAVAEEAK
jgi:hypothetical protein